MIKAQKLALMYSALSIVLGPALVFVIAGGHPSGWDCYDSSWDLSVPAAAREAIYDHNALPMLVGSYVMMVVGIGLFAYLLYDAFKYKRVVSALGPALLMLVMLLGYFAIIAVASSPWC